MLLKPIPHRIGFLITVLLTLSTGCRVASRVERRKPSWAANLSAFDGDIRELQSAMAIPGLAYVIVQDGVVVASKAYGTMQGSATEAFTTTSPLRLASITKSFTAVVAMQLVEEGRLDLEAPAHRYAPGLAVSDDVLVRHLLTHTSESNLGEEFVYSSTRFAMLGSVIETITGNPLEQVFRERVQNRAGMKAYPSPSLGAQGGLVSTVDDMATYLVGLDRGLLLRPASVERLSQPSRSASGATLPISLGWFAQDVQGRRVVWSFGQDALKHSGALLLRLPERRLSLFLLANANVVSDAFRLLMGDVAKSPFAMSYLRLFAFSEPGSPLPRPAWDGPDLPQEVARLERQTSYRYSDELLGRALVDLWRERTTQAQQKFEFASLRYGAFGKPDPVLHFATSRLPDAHMKQAAIRMGGSLLSQHPRNRWMLLAQGYLLQQQDRLNESAVCFQRILDLPNQEPDDLNRLFKAWSWMALAQASAPSNPAEARLYLDKVIASGVDEDVLQEAQNLRLTLAKPPSPHPVK